MPGQYLEVKPLDSYILGKWYFLSYSFLLYSVFSYGIVQFWKYKHCPQCQNVLAYEPVCRKHVVFI